MQISSKEPSVLLVSLPWTSLTEPSLGLGILKAVLEQQKIPCKVMHLNLFLLEHLKANTYYALANVFALNDFLFSGVLDAAISNKQKQWLWLKTRELLSFNQINEKEYGGIDGVVEKLLWLRQDVFPKWLNKWADEIAASNATLVGFTCMFDQTIASLSLANLIKQRAPDKMIALGGYAVRSPTGEAILKSFPCIDTVCDGEGEEVITKLAKASSGEIPLSCVPNILFRTDANKINFTMKATSVNLNDIPVPNYEDFFVDKERLLRDYQIDIKVDRLPLENSRGCWWGQTKHCVFCGINDEDLRYRHKNSDKVIHDMDSLKKLYGFNSFRFSDYILPHQYFKTLLPELVQKGRPYRIISEMKSNINKEQFALLTGAGFDEVQPGIESFSSNVLRKMDKGVTAVQNVYTLLLGKYHGVAVRYNILYGLPDDDPDEINAMIELIPRLFHLDPPSTRLQIQITRFAPLQTNPERFGISCASYEPSYDIIFSAAFLTKTNFDLNDYCYYFERTYENSPVRQRCCLSMSVSKFSNAIERLNSLGLIFQEEGRIIGLAIREV